MTTTSEFATSTKTRIMYSLVSLGVATLAEAIAGVIAFYIVDVKNLPVTWYSTFWFFYTIYNALNNPALGYMSDRTRSRFGRRTVALHRSSKRFRAFEDGDTARCFGRSNS